MQCLTREGAEGASSRANLVEQLTPPRAVWVMFPSGEPTESTVNTLADSLSPGDAVVSAPPTFGMYPFLARLHAARLIEVPRGQDFGLDLPAMESAVGEGAKLPVVAFADNPPGSAQPR